MEVLYDQLDLSQSSNEALSSTGNSTLQTIEQHQGSNQVLIAYGGTGNIQSFQLG